VWIPAVNGARISELQGLLPKLRHPITVDRRCFPRPPRAQRLERLAGLDENRRVARRGLVASHNHIDVERIQLDAATNAPGLLGGDESRAGAEERVDDDAAAIGKVEKRADFGKGGPKAAPGSAPAIKARSRSSLTL
jgi:hypothetical protein